MKLLALETSTQACSAALSIDGDIHEQFEIAPRGHGQLILNMVDQLLAEAQLQAGQLDGIAFGRGPGAFTGVRIATAVVQGIAFGADLPVVPVSSLAALAQGAYRQGRHRAVLAAFDARMEEVYWGAFEEKAGLMVACGAERVCPPQDVVMTPAVADWVGAGDGWQAYPEALKAACGDVPLCHHDTFPHAQDIARLALPQLVDGETVMAEQALPIYLRDNVVKKRSG